MNIHDLYPDVITEDTQFEFKSTLSKDSPIKWAKTIVAYANNGGGTIFVGVSNDREAFGLSLDDIDKTKNLVSLVNDRNIFPHVKIRFQLRSVDEQAERFVLAINVLSSDSIVRYREGDFNETVYIKGDGNAVPASPEEIITLHKRKFGVDNSVSDILYDETKWKGFIELCKEFRSDNSKPMLKELQNLDIVSSDGFVKTGFLMFMDGYEGEETRVHCRLWQGDEKLGVVLDKDYFKGSLSYVLVSALNFIERNTKTGWEKTPNGGRKEVRSYPRVAIREAVVNAIAHRDYSIYGTQIDIDIYNDRMDIVSPGSWLLPRSYEEYEVGDIPSIRRNGIVSACLDAANLMERGGTGFYSIANSYANCAEDKQPMVIAYPGFLKLRLFDMLYEPDSDVKNRAGYSTADLIVDLLSKSPRTISELQRLSHYKSRAQFLKKEINPLLMKGIIYRDGNPKSPTALFKLK